jgi:PhnB protein
MSRRSASGELAVLPYLKVESVEETIRFLAKVFGIAIKWERAPSDGQNGPSELRLGDSLVMIARRDAPPTASSGALYVWVADVDALFKAALDEGATPVDQPHAQGSGRRAAVFNDPQGNSWWIASQVPKLSNAEVERRLTQQRKKRL